MRHRFVIVFGLCLIGLFTGRLEAAPAVPSSAAPAPAVAKVVDERPPAPDSPRAAMLEFRRLSRAGDYAGAARFLDLSGLDKGADGSALARELKEVLNQRLWVDADKISAESHGSSGDSEPPDTEQLGTIRAASGKLEPVVLVRKNYRTGARWVFSASTVAQVQGWYDHLESLWISQHVPKPLLHMGPKLLRWWQWIALGPLLMVAWLVAHVMTRALRWLAKRTLPEKQAEAAHQLRGPVSLAIATGISYGALPWLGLYQPADQFLSRWCSALLMVAAFWGLWRAVELSRLSVSTSRWAKESMSAHSLLSLGARLAKFAVAAAALMLILSQLGYPATTILTGLGIGGVALALAAQKTVENLFGTFSLAIDQPFREGDAIKVDGIEGVVEAIGLRSTRIRGPERSVFCIPNGKLADMRVETISRQDRLRFACQLGLDHAAAAQLDALIAQLRASLLTEPLVAQDSAAVRLVAVNDAALIIELTALVNTTDGGKFLDTKQQLLLSALRVIHAAGATLAHPQRTIELVGASKPSESAAPDASKPERSSAPRLSGVG